MKYYCLYLGPPVVSLLLDITFNDSSVTFDFIITDNSSAPIKGLTIVIPSVTNTAVSISQPIINTTAVMKNAFEIQLDSLTPGTNYTVTIGAFNDISTVSNLLTDKFNIPGNQLLVIELIIISYRIINYYYQYQ